MVRRVWGSVCKCVVNVCCNAVRGTGGGKGVAGMEPARRQVCRAGSKAGAFSGGGRRRWQGSTGMKLEGRCGSWGRCNVCGATAWGVWAVEGQAGKRCVKGVAVRVLGYEETARCEAEHQQVACPCSSVCLPSSYPSHPTTRTAQARGGGARVGCGVAVSGSLFQQVTSEAPSSRET